MTEENSPNTDTTETTDPIIPDDRFTVDHNASDFVSGFAKNLADADSLKQTEEEATEEAPEEDSQQKPVEEDKNTDNSPEDNNVDIKEEDQESTYKAPNNWTKEEKKDFDNLPESIELEDGTILDVKKNIIKHANSFDADYRHKTQELAEEKRALKGLTDVLSPYAEKFKAQNINPANYVQELIQTAESLQQNPVGVLKQLMTAFKVSPEQLGLTDNVQGSDSDNSDDDYLTEEEVKLKKENKALRQEVDDIKKSVNSIQSNTEHANVNKILEDFAKVTNDSGTLKHPHFDNEDVKKEMHILLGTGKTLQEAYANSPTARNLDQDTSNNETAGEKRAKQVRKVTQAKRASMKVKNANISTIDFNKMSFGEALKHNLNNNK